MANPKQKRSKSNIRTRRRNWKLRRVTLSVCPHCRKPRLPHHACLNCGYYNGRQAVKVGDDQAASKAKG
jgi:large subunit ribosomal protein L32